MAILEVRTQNDLPVYKYLVALDGTTYLLDFLFNARVSKWFLQVSDASGNLLLAPVPVVSTWPIIKRFRDTRLPIGTVFPFDTSGNNEDPGRFDLGDRVRMLYEEGPT